jgi:hypothetical protein
MPMNRQTLLSKLMAQQVLPRHLGCEARATLRLNRTVSLVIAKFPPGLINKRQI